MRYIADNDGYVKQVSFGADIVCDGEECTQYTGSVPAGYKTLEEWFSSELEKLYRWKIVNGNLTLDSSAVAPAEGNDSGWLDATKSSNVNSDAVVKYRQIGKEVRVRISNCTTQLAMTAANYDSAKLVGYGLPVPAATQFCAGMVNNSAALFYVAPSGDSNPGYLRFFGPASSIAKGANVRGSFSYLID